MALYPFRVHSRRYKRVVCQLHRPISRQFEPIEPLTVAAEHSQGAPKIFNTPGVDLGRSTGANGDVQGRKEVGLSPLTHVALYFALQLLYFTLKRTPLNNGSNRGYILRPALGP